MWISRDLSNGRNHHATEDFIGNLVSEQSPGLCPFVQKQCRCLPSRSVDPSFDFFTFSFKIPPFSPSAVSWVLAQLTKTACSTFTSTAKSLAGRDQAHASYDGHTQGTRHICSWFLPPSFNLHRFPETHICRLPTLTAYQAIKESASFQTIIIRWMYNRSDS